MLVSGRNNDSFEDNGQVGDLNQKSI